MDTELAQCLIIRNPDWYEDEGFLRFLNGKRATTWHCKGEPVGELCRDYKNHLAGFEEGFREEWEKRVLEDIYENNEPGKRVKVERFTGEEMASFEVRQENYHHAGRFYKDTTRHFDRGEKPDYLIRKGDQFWNGQEWGPLRSAKLYHRAYYRNKKLAEGLGGEVVRLGDIQARARTKVVEMSGLDVAKAVWGKFDDDHRRLWQDADGVWKLGVEHLSRWYLDLCDLEEIETILRERGE